MTEKTDTEVERLGRKYLLIFAAGLFIVAVVNLASFFMFIKEPRLFYYRPWEYFYELAYRFEAFEPDWHLEQYADLSRRNFFYYQGHRYTDVTVDNEGYRSVPYESQAYPILVSGDSLVFGSGLSDSETLPWKLAERIDVPVFNGGRSSLLNTLKKAELADVRLVVDVRGEPLIFGDVFADYGYAEDEPYRSRISNEFSLWQIPEIIPSQRYLLTSIAYRAILRMWRDLLVLKTGEKDRLYMGYNLSNASLTQAVESIEQRSKALADRGIKYVFVAVPFEQTLYANYVDEGRRNYLKRLDKELARRGVDTVFLLDRFLEHRSEEIFFRYDTHWSPLGVELALEEILTYVNRMDFGQL